MSHLPDWGRDDLPEPLPFSIRNVFRTIGPGAILLAASIGGGEWLVGPTMAVKYGMGVFWIATVAIVLQLVFNLEAMRYTLYTGEPIFTGIMRLRPGSRVWGTLYIVLTVVQLGMPALAAGCASVLFAGYFGTLPGAARTDQTTLMYITFGVIALGVALLMSGGKIERTLEYLSWAMIAYIFVFLFVANIFFVPAAHWAKTAGGFVQFGYIPEKMDLMLLAALATTAGSGGIGNLTISNWARDKGFGMGGKVGAIASAFGSEHHEPSHVGKVFPITADNLRRWALWWKYVQLDQVWLWALGCFLGMFLNVNLATAIIPGGENIDTSAAGAYQAMYMAQHYWSGFWILALLNGFWILFSTHLGNTDVLVRTVTDILWTASGRVRAWRGGSISTIYYALLALFTVWGLAAISFQWTAMDLFKFLGAIAGVVLAIAAMQVLFVNTRLLPPELRPSWWRKGALVLCSLFYLIVTSLVVWDQAKKMGLLDWARKLQLFG